MGLGVLVECRFCNVTEMYSVGVGMRDWSLEASIRNVPRRNRRRVLEILEHHEVQEVEYGFRPYECPTCELLDSRFHYRIVYDRHEVLESSFRCRSCRRRLQPLDHMPPAGSLSRYRCHHCGAAGGLVVSGEMCWD